MDLAFAGLYAKLKDRNTPLTDKLQVFRFAWKSKDVFIPNKEQVLIDLLCGYLVNKKKHQFTEEDTSKVFKCLHDVLLSKKAHQKQADGQGLLVKQSLSQMITETLSTRTDDCNEEHLNNILGCCHALITSPTIAYVFTDRLDIMVSLLGSLCMLLYKAVLEGGDQRQLLTLTQETTDLFVKCQQTAHDQNTILKVTLEKLLPSFIKLCSVCKTEEVTRMRNIVLNVLCHKDQAWSYRGYLLGLFEDKLPDETDFGKIQHINHLFQGFSDILDKEKTTPEAVIDVLVHFYERFTENKKTEEELKLCHYLLKKLCALIGVNETDSTLSGILAPPLAIKAAERLLQAVLRHDLYNVSADNRNGHPQLKFYRVIVKILLENISLTADWYSCCHTLLMLNHHTIEPSLTTILLKGWIGVKKQQPDEVLSKVGDFLQELVVTYHKLRQFPKIIDVLIATFKTSTGDAKVELLPKFVKSYGECVQSLPQATMVTIWTKYLDHMIQEFVADQPSSTNTCHFHGISLLLYHFITNVKVIDYSITDLTLTSVKGNLEKMSTELFKPLLKEQSENEEIDVSTLSSILNLCHGWGEVVAMVIMYTQYNMEEMRTKSVRPESHDVTYIHSYLRKKHWKLLHKRVEVSDNMSLHYYWDVLMIQKIRTLMLCRDVSDWSVVHNTMESLIKFPCKVSQESLNATWSGSIDDITNDNIVVARWHLIVNNMAVLYANLSQENMENIATFIVNTASHTNSATGDVMMLCSITKRLLESTQMREYGGLLTCVVTAVWLSLAECRAKHRSKKQKLEPVMEGAMNVYGVLGDTDVEWKQSMNSESLEKILEASKCLTSLLELKKKGVASVQPTRMASCLQVISYLPLEHMSSCDQIRCLIGLLSTKSLVDANGNQSDSEELSKLSRGCIKLCTVILESGGMSPVFQVISVDTYITWLTSLLPKQSQMDSSFFETMLFIEFSCWSIVKDYKVLVNLPVLVHKLQKDMANVDEDTQNGLLVVIMYLLQETNRMLSRSYLNESLREICQTIQQGLSDTILTRVSLLPNQHCGLTEAVVVNAMSTLVSASVKQADLQPVLNKQFPDVWKWCSHVLKKDTQLFPKMAALHFLQSISRCHKVFDETISAETKHEIWNLLVGFLKDLLKMKSNDSNTMKKKDGDSAKIRNVKGENRTDVVNYKTVLNLLNEKTHEMGKVEETTTDRSETEPVPMTCGSTILGDKVYRASMITNLYHSLVFEGKLLDQSTSLLLKEVQAVMASLLASFDLENFTSIVQRIVDDMHVSNLTTDRQMIQCFVFVWQYLLKLEFSDQHSQCIKSAAEKMVSNTQSILQQSQHHTSEVVVMDTVLPILQSMSQMLNISKRFLSGRSVTQCLQGCTSVPLEGAALFPVFHAVCDILDTLLIHHTHIVLQNIPAFIGCAKRLLVSLVKRSDQTKLAGNTTSVSNLSNCAYMLERLFLEISNHKVAFNKVAVYVISDYVTAVERVTLLPSLKRSLLPVVYKMLDLCDNFAIAQLHKILSYGEVEVFRILYLEYKKFHKFSGKV